LDQKWASAAILSIIDPSAARPQVWGMQAPTQILAPSRSPRLKLGSRRHLAAPEVGFLGPGHEAIQVLGSEDLAATDPFVLLMDDRIDFPVGRKVGDAHPHAGLETVTFVLEGGLADQDEGELHAGDMVWMTAGRGVVHSEHVFSSGTRTRVLQLWIALPERDRAAPPRIEVLHARDLPVYRAPGVEARLYSGSTHDLVSSTRNYVPTTLLDVRLEAGAKFEQDFPRSYNGFLYPITGEVRVGSETDSPLGTGEVGWFDCRRQGEASRLELNAGANGARVILYAGQRQDEPLIHYGPFVAGSEADIARMYREYRAGRFARVSQLTDPSHPRA
jgi:quercetin 2,3-dioxygenase